MVNAVIIPDSQVLAINSGADFSAKLIPHTPITGAVFNCTGYSATTQFYVAWLDSRGRQVSTTLGITAGSFDATGATFSLLWSTLQSVILLGLPPVFSGCLLGINDGGDSALLWAGQVQLVENLSQVMSLS